MLVLVELLILIIHQLVERLVLLHWHHQGRQCHRQIQRSYLNLATAALGLWFSARRILIDLSI